MRYRQISKNKEKISSFGIGTMRLPKNKKGIDKKKAKELIYYAIDNGVNFIDTAFLYHGGESEIFLGDILKGDYRKKVNISTKLPSWTVKNRQEMDLILNKQLKRLKTSYIDYYFVHNINYNLLKKLDKKGLFDFLEKAKKDNKIKYIGFSYHGSKDEFKKTVDYYNWDMCMVQYNYFDDNIQASLDGIQYAKSKKMGIFVMEPLKGGILAGKMPYEVNKVFNNSKYDKSPAEWALSWVLNHKEITCVLSGVNNLDQLKENISISNKIKANSLTNYELEVISNAKKALEALLKINCTTCGYCLPCPQGVNIPEAFKIYNEKYLFKKKRGIIYQSLFDYFMILSPLINKGSYASLCNDCKKCLRKCPQNLKINEDLKLVSKEFEGYGFKFKVLFLKYIGLPISEFFSKLKN